MKTKYIFIVCYLLIGCSKTPMVQKEKILVRNNEISKSIMLSKYLKTKNKYVYLGGKHEDKKDLLKDISEKEKNGLAILNDYIASITGEVNHIDYFKMAKEFSEAEKHLKGIDIGMVVEDLRHPTIKKIQEIKRVLLILEEKERNE